MKACLTAALILFALPASAEILSSIDPATLPKAKRTPLGLYLTPAEAHAALEADPGIVFVDVRDPIEITFVGHPDSADAIVPIAVATHRYDPVRGGYAMDLNGSFVAEVEAAVTRDGKGKNDPVFVMCRSGVRSAAAASILAEAGFTNVWSLVEGFEGDSDKETGERTVNGWKNAGLPWSMKIGKSLAWQPDGQ